MHPLFEAITDEWRKLGILPEKEKPKVLGEYYDAEPWEMVE